MDELVSEALREPFPAAVIGKLPRVTCKKCREAPSKVCGDHSKSKCEVCGNYITSAHIHLDYVGHAAVTDRLLSVDALWSWVPMARDPGHGGPVLTKAGTEPGEECGLWIELTVCGITRPGFGCGKTAKEAISDAIRNAAMRFGVALDLWARDGLPGDTEEAGGEPAASSAEFDPGKRLLPGAPSGPEVFELIAAKQQLVDPSLDWQPIGRQLRLSRYGVDAWAKLDAEQQLDFVTRYSNAMTRLTDQMDGDFPPLDDSFILEAIAWAFDGAVVEIVAAEVPPQVDQAAPTDTESDGDAVPVQDGTEEADAELEARERAEAEDDAAAEERAAAGSTGPGAYDRD